MGSVPYGLLGSQFGRFDPMGQDAQAGRDTHSLEVAVQHPEGPDQVNESKGRLPFTVQHVEDLSQGGTEAYDQVDNGRKGEPGGHEFLLAEAVGQDAVDETGHAVDYAVGSHESPEFGLGDSQFCFHRRHCHAEILPHEIIQGICYHQGDNGPPLPIDIFLLLLLIHLVIVLSGVYKDKKIRTFVTDQKPRR